MQPGGFQEVWEASKHNSFSWGYPAAILCGGIVLARLSWIPRSVVRRVLKIVTILTFGFIAWDFSARETAEKWRLRQDWASAFREQMTEAQWLALSADGANRTLGPLIYGFQATGLLVGLAAVLFVARRLNSTAHAGDESQKQIHAK